MKNRIRFEEVFYYIDHNMFVNITTSKLMKVKSKKNI